MLSTRFRIFALLAAAITLSAAGAQSEPTPGKGKVRQGVGAKQAKRQKGMQAAQAKAGAKPKAGANPKAAAKKDAKPQTEPAVIDERAEGVLREW
ncbi:MAG: hypothetical protein KDA32_12425, partial [Phycisphaerales bacterium]|nr:hypothetical protein [Phycisphaerales bacterium]